MAKRTLKTYGVKTARFLKYVYGHFSTPWWATTSVGKRYFSKILCVWKKEVSETFQLFTCVVHFCIYNFSSDQDG